MAIDNNVFDSLLNNERKVAKKYNHSHLRLIKEYNENGVEKALESNQKLIGDTIETNQSQKRDITKTNQRQTEDKSTLGSNPEKTMGDKLETKRETEYETKERQNRDNNTSEISFFEITGNERQLVLYIYTLCKKTLDKITMPLSTEHLVKTCNIKDVSIKKALQRLEKKNILIREKFKRGRGGWTRYSLSKNIYDDILHTEENCLIETKWRQIEDKLESKLKTKIETIASSSSSDMNNTTTRQTQDSNNESQLSSQWEEIEIAPLEDIGFSKHHLKQIASQNKISHIEVQESINAFAFDMKINNKTKHLKTNPLNYFMGILRNGIPYAPPSNYKSQKEIEMEQYLARKKEEKERIKKLEDEIIECEFVEWLETINETQRNEIVGELQQAHMYSDKVKESVARTRLLEHFKQNIKLTTERL